MFRVVLDLLYPPTCPACGAPGARGLCVRCCATFPWITQGCPRCALPVHGSRCARCASWSPAFDGASSAARYAGPARDAILRFKLGGERRAATALAEPMVRYLGTGAITFVPATRRSVAARGFNPAEVLARALARQADRPMVPLLRKVRDTADQAGLSRAERAANLATAIQPVGVMPERVMLVDDILTTGATAEACARALKQGGAYVVNVMTFARTV